MMETGYNLPMSVLAALYLAIMVAAVIWLAFRIVRYRRFVRARRSSEAMMAQELSHGDFQEYLEGLRAQRAADNGPDSTEKRDV